MVRAITFLQIPVKADIITDRHVPEETTGFQVRHNLIGWSSVEPGAYCIFTSRIVHICIIAGGAAAFTHPEIFMVVVIQDTAVICPR